MGDTTTVLNVSRACNSKRSKKKNYLPKAIHNYKSLPSYLPNEESQTRDNMKYSFRILHKMANLRIQTCNLWL